MEFLTFDHFRKQLDRIEADLVQIKKQGEHHMTQLDDLNTKIATIQGSISQLGADLTAAIADLKAKIAAAGTGPDLTSQLAALDSIATSLTSLDTQAKAE